MKLKFTKEKIEFEKQLNSLDNFTIDFSRILKKVNINYVIVSGYVSILFGRSRSSEDIDIIIEHMDLLKFKQLWNELNKEFECINSKNADNAYTEYLLTHHAIRFSRKNEFIPNIEVKFPKTDLDFWVLMNKKKVLLNNNEMFISPIELQIPFKLFLGSEKDIEDAKYLYKLFKDKIDVLLLEEFNRKLKIEQSFNRYLK